MTQDEHDAKCWRLLKAAIVETAPNLSCEAREVSAAVQSLMAAAEVSVDSQSNARHG